VIPATASYHRIKVVATVSAVEPLIRIARRHHLSQRLECLAAGALLMHPRAALASGMHVLEYKG
jgi:hypothetical protein